MLPVGGFLYAQTMTLLFFIVIIGGPCGPEQQGSMRANSTAIDCGLLQMNDATYGQANHKAVEASKQLLSPESIESRSGGEAGSPLLLNMLVAASPCTE